MMGSDLGYQRQCCKRLRCPSWLTQQTPRSSQPQPEQRHSSGCTIPPWIILIFLSVFHTLVLSWVLHPGIELGMFLFFFLGFLQGCLAEPLCSSGSRDCTQHPPSSEGISSKTRKKNFPLEWYFPAPVHSPTFPCSLLWRVYHFF